MFCNHCGAEFPAGQSFCGSCGRSLAAGSGTAAASPRERGLVRHVRLLGALWVAVSALRLIGAGAVWFAWRFFKLGGIGAMRGPEPFLPAMLSLVSGLLLVGPLSGISSGRPIGV